MSNRMNQRPGVTARFGWAFLLGLVCYGLAITAWVVIR